MPNTISPVRKENPASHALVFRRNILNLNFNLDMSCAIPGASITNITPKYFIRANVTFYT